MSSAIKHRIFIANIATIKVVLSSLAEIQIGQKELILGLEGHESTLPAFRLIVCRLNQ